MEDNIDSMLISIEDINIESEEFHNRNGIEMIEYLEKFISYESVQYQDKLKILRIWKDLIDFGRSSHKSVMYERSYLKYMWGTYSWVFNDYSVSLGDTLPHYAVFDQAPATVTTSWMEVLNILSIIRDEGGKGLVYGGLRYSHKYSRLFDNGFNDKLDIIIKEDIEHAMFASIEFVEHYGGIEDVKPYCRCV